MVEFRLKGFIIDDVMSHNQLITLRVVLNRKYVSRTVYSGDLNNKHLNNGNI